MYEENDIDRAVVRALCLHGDPHDEIANYIGISVNTLKKYYGELLENCREDKIGAVRKSLYYNAVIKKSVEAQKFWLQNMDKETFGINNTSNNLDATEILQEIADNLPD